MSRFIIPLLMSAISLFLLPACGGTQATQFNSAGGNKSDFSSTSESPEFEEGGKNSENPRSSGVCTAGQMTPQEAAQISSQTPIIYNQAGGTIRVGYGGAYVKIYGNGNTIDVQVGGGSLVIEIYGGGNSLVGGGGSSIIHLYGDGNTVNLNGGGSNILKFYGVSNTLMFGGGGCNSAGFSKGLLFVNNDGGGGGNGVNGELAVTKTYSLP